MTSLQAILIAIVEGVTEFLPISSTGHMIIAQAILGMKSDAFLKVFTVNIQFGAILSVLVLYWRSFFQSVDFYLKLFVAFIPAAIIGFVLDDAIDSMLESVTTVAIMLVLGGIVLLFMDTLFNQEKLAAQSQEVSWLKALYIGLFQCIALIPGVSRSAATIVGGMTQGLTRKNAAEFSFFLAVPTMAAASAYKLLKAYKTDANLLLDNIDLLLLGNLVAFGVALAAIKFFIGFLTRNGFRAFGWYRIIVGLAILIAAAAGVPLTIE